MDVNVYSTGMQSWVDIHVTDEPQNDCIPPLAPTILTPSSGALLSTSTVIITGTGEANAVINVTIDAVTVT